MDRGRDSERLPAREPFREIPDDVLSDALLTEAKEEREAVTSDVSESGPLLVDWPGYGKRLPPREPHQSHEREEVT